MIHSLQTGQLRLAFWVLLGGLAVLVGILLWVAAFHGRAVVADESEDPTEEHYQAPHAMPWLLILVWITAILFGIGHTLYVGLTGVDW